MKIREREQAILALIEEYREAECRRLIDRAREKAAALLEQTFQLGRKHLHQRVTAERDRARQRLQGAEAEMTTRRRQHAEQANAVLLKAAWPYLREHLVAQWQQNEFRRRWTERYVSLALEVLPHQDWRIYHAVEWREPEQRSIRAGLDKNLEDTPRFVVDEAIAAGLIIECRGSKLDASIDGLLADREHLEARLLALFASGGEV